jgi:hypothetical protein
VLFAQSLYLGGEIIEPDECDYDSYAYLGLNCPFCRTAVFLVKPHSRNLGTKTALIPGHFSHFAGGGECESKSTTAKGKQELERVASLAKNQRLKVYQRRLWLLIKNDRNVSRSDLAAIRKKFGDNWCRNMVKLIQLEIRANSDILQEKIIDLADPSQKKSAQALLTESAKIFDNQELDSQSSRDAIENQARYLADCDLRIHCKICGEILSFVGVESGSEALNRLLEIALQYLWAATSEQMSINEMKGFDSIIYTNWITGLISGTQWFSQLGKELENC